MKELTIEITNNCFNHCIHCSSSAICEWDLQNLDEERPKKEQVYTITKPQLIKVLEENPDFDRIRFSGGEPTTHPLLLEFLREAKLRNKHTTILTSGVCYNNHEFPERLLTVGKEYINKIAFSIFGSENIHNKITKNEDAYSSLERSISRVSSNKIPFSFNFVPMTPNFNYLKNIFEFISNNKPDYCTPSLVILRCITQGNAHINKDISLTEPQISKISQEAKDLSLKYNIPVYLGCSFAKTYCNARIGKRVYTYQGEYIDCSALKFHPETRRTFQCSDRW
jgi:MoaA/NifB/PqqE/SkfB family radical SAM enzyme